MPVTIEEISAEVTPPAADRAPSAGAAPSQVDPETERRRMQDLLKGMEVRAARIRAD